MNSQLQNSRALFSLWRNWALSVGAVSLVLIFSVISTSAWLPLIIFGIELALFAYVRYGRASGFNSCFLMTFVTTRILFWSAVVMAVLYFLSSRGITETWDPLHNREVPYIPAMIIGPVSMLVCGWAILRRHNFVFCMECSLQHGTPAERGYLGQMFSREGRFQVQFFFMLCTVLTVLAGLYYWLFYINVNLNSPDKFAFVWLPVILNVVSLGYFGARYFTLWSYYDQELAATTLGRADKSLLRYLMLDGEKVFLAEPDKAVSVFSRGLDTPAVVTLSRREDVPLHEARNYFARLVDSEKFSIRFMYHSIDAGGTGNVFHFIVNVGDDEVVKSRFSMGKWYTLSEIERLLNNNMLAPVRSAEIHRLYTVTMAWKTYDRTGRRLYKVKNYRPTFRLRDIQNWDVDFNDPQWLRVSVNNQDKPFYALRRFWRRRINGIKE